MHTTRIDRIKHAICRFWFGHDHGDPITYRCLDCGAGEYQDMTKWSIDDRLRFLLARWEFLWLSDKQKRALRLFFGAEYRSPNQS